VLTGTAITATSNVSQNALMAAGVVTDAQTAPSPGSSVRQNTTPTGMSSSAAR
jgi:hypothetical protein